VVELQKNFSAFAIITPTGDQDFLMKKYFFRIVEQ